VVEPIYYNDSIFFPCGEFAKWKPVFDDNPGLGLTVMAGPKGFAGTCMTDSLPIFLDLEDHFIL